MTLPAGSLEKVLAALRYLAYERNPVGEKYIDTCSETCQQMVIEALSEGEKSLEAGKGVDQNIKGDIIAILNQKLPGAISLQGIEYITDAILAKLPAQQLQPLDRVLLAISICNYWIEKCLETGTIKPKWEELHDAGREAYLEEADYIIKAMCGTSPTPKGESNKPAPEPVGGEPDPCDKNLPWWDCPRCKERINREHRRRSSEET